MKMIKTAFAVGFSVAVLAGCGGPQAGTSNPSSAPAATHASTKPSVRPSTEPTTASGVKAAAQKFYDLYAAGQYGDAYALIAPSDQKAVTKATYVAVFEGCPSNSAGMSRVIKHVTMDGSTAIVTETVAGALGKLGSVTDTFVYVDGQWYFKYPPSVLALYGHGSVAADVQAAKDAGYCAAS